MISCINCRHVGFLFENLTCWRNSPTAQTVSCDSCETYSVQAVQPPVEPTDRCGEFEQATRVQALSAQRTYQAIQHEIEVAARDYLEEVSDDGESKIVTLRTAKPRGNA